MIASMIERQGALGGGFDHQDMAVHPVLRRLAPKIMLAGPVIVVIVALVGIDGCRRRARLSAEPADVGDGGIPFQPNAVALGGKQ